MGYAIISLILINLYYKIFKFTLMKPSITENEFNKLWKKRQVTNLKKKLLNISRGRYKKNKNI